MLASLVVKRNESLCLEPNSTGNPACSFNCLARDVAIAKIETVTFDVRNAKVEDGISCPKLSFDWRRIAVFSSEVALIAHSEKRNTKGINTNRIAESVIRKGSIVIRI